MRTLLILTLATGCKDSADDSTSPWAPDVWCPGGGDGCPDNEGPLRAGAAAVDITPQCFESWTDLDGSGDYSTSRDSFNDCGCDRICPEDPEYPGADSGEGDGTFQPIWMAGFGNGRGAQGVHDPLWARAIVLDQGETRLAIVAVDLVGFFNTDVVRVREMLPEELAIDHLIINATHAHEGPDTMGLWGARVGQRGVNDIYIEEVRQNIVASVSQAVAGLEAVQTLTVGRSYPAEAHARGQANVMRDSRDPVVITDEVGAAILQNAAGETIATLVNWGSHPETLSSDNTLITSDFVDPLRRTLEEGSSWAAYEREGLGGTCIFLQGMVGGMMTPLGISVHDPDGNVWTDASFEKSNALGQLVGEMALDAITNGEAVAEPKLSFASMEVVLPVDNIAFQAMFRLGVFERELYGYDPDEDIDDDNKPEVHTELGVVRLGPIGLLTIPGELLPEVAIGGYDGSKVGTDLYTLIDPENVAPPDLSLAPAAPYLRERLASEHAWILGLANDELGYIIPAYDFVLDPEVPYLTEAEGDHYEETNSLGPETEPLLSDAAAQLLEWSP